MRGSHRRGRVLAGYVAVATALVLAAAGPAGAADKGTFSLTDTSQTASWSGELQAGGPVLPDVCIVSPDACDVARVDVRLPAGTWDRPGGMLVATHPGGQFGATTNWFELYVYDPFGRQVAKATSFWSTGTHSVWLENVANGLYTIVVAPTAIAEPPARYDGLISFDRGVTIRRNETKDGMPFQQTVVAFGRTSPTPAAQLLPDLVPTTPDNFHIATGVCTTYYLCGDEPTHQPSCYAEEMSGANTHPPGVGPHPQRCLRFDQGERNVGDGPFELHIYPSKDGVVYQRVWSTDGHVDQYAAGGTYFAPAHAHFHFTGNGAWWDIKLHKRLPNGAPGEIVAAYVDKGVCPLDTTNVWFGQPANSPQAFGHSDGGPCTTPRQQDPNDPTFPDAPPYIQAGISAGWADEYPWQIQDQYIDITNNVPDGKYVIVTKQDPAGSFREKSTANNTSMACVEIMNTTEARACPPGPDLEVTSLSVANNKSVRQGDKVTIAATVTNTGDGDAAASNTELSLDGSRMADGLLATPALRAGESVRLLLQWDTRAVKGDHSIRATADSDRAVEESNEENNVRETTVSVRGNGIL